MKRKLTLRTLALPALLLSTLIYQPSTSFAQGTAFTYQGRLAANGSPATGNYDLRFTLYDAVTKGAAVTGSLTYAPTAASNGLFTVTLDFGTGIFTGAPRWLEIGVRTNGSVAAYSILSPRQALTPSPCAIYATTSGTASNVVNGSVVRSLNGLKDIVTLAAGSNVTITPSGNTLKIASAGVGGSGIWSANGNNAYYTAGNVGIGTTGPATALEANGLVRSTRTGVAPQYIQLNGGDSGSIKLTAQSTLAAEKNLFIENLSGEPTPGANNNIQFELGTTTSPSVKMTITKDGSVGIGTVNPQARLHVSNPGDSVSQRIETGGGVNAWTRTEFANANGQWNIGTSRDFNGDEFYFYRQGATVNAFAIEPNGDALLQGNLGIGTTTPVARLHAETSQAYTAAVYGNTTGTGGVGVFGQSAAANGTGVYGVSATGAAVHAEGNATQARDKGGFVKAMLFVEADGTISRCYNGVTGSSANGCGFSVGFSQSGEFFSYVVTFPFQVSDRFATVTTGPSGFAQTGANIRYFGNTIGVNIFVTNQDWQQGNAHASFTLILY